MSMRSEFRSSSKTMAFDNPMMNGKLDYEVDDLQPPVPSSRRCSKDQGTQVGKLPDYYTDDCYHFEATHDALPRMEHYRNILTMNKHILRPTLDELHYPQTKEVEFGRFSDEQDDEDKPKSSGAIKFGWIRGVYMRCLLNIWGVLLFLRMGWMVGQAGMGLSLVIVGLATVVTILTTMSMSAICTNGEIGGGGVYYLVSRCLGPEIGGAVGLMFSFATSVAVAMYIVGAAETIRDLLRTYDTGIVEYPSSFNDIRLTGVLLLALMYSITGVGMLFENAAQIVLLFILLVALMDYFVGSCITPTIQQVAAGFVGWDAHLAKVNFGPDFRGEDFFSVFSVFFPSVIGITAGANISGDLKDACYAIPKGTLLAIISTSGSYVLIIVWLGFTILRDATGNVADVLNGTFTNCTGHPCPEGLLNNNQVMGMSAGFGPLIFAGIFAASLSSALAALISAPRIFQALCKDRVFPALTFFGKGYGAQNDPRRASVVAVLLALIFTLIADLNAIAPIISNFFMATYGLVNFACFHASLVKSPGFRPGFKYFNKWLSLVGALLCGVVMFIMNWITALITWCIAGAIYLYIQKNKTGINWGSSTQGYSYKNALSAVLKLNKVEEHVKNYRPAILVLTGNPSSRPPLVDFTHNITRKLGLMVCGHVIKGPLPQSVRSATVEHNSDWLKNRKISALYSLVESNSLLEGVHYLLQLVGLGKLKPNILLMGYKTQWQECSQDDLLEYFNLIHLAFDMHLSLVILRVAEGMDYHEFFETDLGIPYADTPNCVASCNLMAPVPSSPCSGSSVIDCDASTIAIDEEIAKEESPLPKKPSAKVVQRAFRRLNSFESAKVHPREVPPEVMNAVNQFQYKQKEGTIDVWWIVDDGGLTMLVPYILSTRSQWADCKLRVFSVAHSENDLDTAQVNMTALLKKFRIDYSSVNVLSDINSTPSATSVQQFDAVINKWLVNDGTRRENITVTRTDVNSHKKKTNRLLRLRELILQHSMQATAIVLTLPMPRKETCPAPLFMSWLEVLTKDLPPVILVRGNQTSVLTFYS